MTTIDLIKTLIERAGLKDTPFAPFTRIMYGELTWDVSCASPTNKYQDTVALFALPLGWRVYLIRNSVQFVAVKGDEVAPPRDPVRLLLPYAGTTMGVEAIPSMELFEAMVIADLRMVATSAAPGGADDDEDEIESAVCENCEAEMPPTFPFCGECGSAMPAGELPSVECKSCGAECEGDAGFCSKCGAKLPEQAKEQEKDKPAGTAANQQPS
jgi:hypothetical protein